jgi:sialic acid synthase SpsE
MNSFYDPILYVAEIGSNHCGSLERAKELILAARDAGAGAVKFQLFSGDTMYGLNPSGSRRKKAIELDKWALRPQWIPELSDLTHAAGMQFICTPFDVASVEWLFSWVDQIKISAYDLMYFDLVSSVCDMGVPVILSTAMANPQEIYKVLNEVCVNTHGVCDITLLHGVAAYPANLGDCSFEFLSFLQSTGCKFGISDHTTNAAWLMSCAYLPITMAEKHFRQFTTPKESPDYAVSADPKEFKDYIRLGNEEREEAIQRLESGPLPCEKVLYNTCRRTNEKPFRK